jgi:hypothetical protein
MAELGPFCRATSHYNESLLREASSSCEIFWIGEGEFKADSAWIWCCHYAVTYSLVMDAISVDGMGPHLVDRDGGSQLANGNTDK